jgi:hypothetical protein
MTILHLRLPCFAYHNDIFFDTAKPVPSKIRNFLSRNNTGITTFALIIIKYNVQ